MKLALTKLVFINLILRTFHLIICKAIPQFNPFHCLLGTLWLGNAIYHICLTICTMCNVLLFGGMSFIGYNSKPELLLVVCDFSVQYIFNSLPLFSEYYDPQSIVSKFHTKRFAAKPSAEKVKYCYVGIMKLFSFT